MASTIAAADGQIHSDSAFWAVLDICDPSSQIAAPLLLADPLTGNSSATTASIAQVGAAGLTPIVFDASTAGQIGRLCYRFGESRFQ